MDAGGQGSKEHVVAQERFVGSIVAVHPIPHEILYNGHCVVLFCLFGAMYNAGRKRGCHHGEIERVSRQQSTLEYRAGPVWTGHRPRGRIFAGHICGP